MGGGGGGGGEEGAEGGKKLPHQTVLCVYLVES